MTKERRVAHTGNKTVAAVIAGLLLSTAMPTVAHAQTVKHPKPVNMRDSCEAAPTYELVQTGSSTPYRTTNASLPGGYDPSAPIAACGKVTRAMPLACVDSTGVPQTNPALCSPGAKLDYESKYVATVFGNPSGMPYYLAESTTMGSAPIITGVRIKAGVVHPCIQIAEIEAYENGVNVALARNGASVSATRPYSGEAPAEKAIDGVRPAGYPNIYHSECGGADQITITFARPARVSKIVVYGRTDYDPGRDLYAYELLNGGTVVGNGQVDARSGSGEASLNGSCDPVDLQWRKTKASVAGVCGTQMVQDKVECVDVSGGGAIVVDESRCTASQRPASQPYQVTSREGCGFDYTATAWSVVAPACGSVTQTRTVSCVGSDGQPASDEMCGRSLTAPSATTPASAFYSAAYAWPGAPGDAISVYRMPSVCDVGSPENVQKDCDAAFIPKNGSNQSYLRPKASREVTDRRSCQTDIPENFAWNSPIYTPDRQNVCGPNTRSGEVFCLKDGTTRVDDSQCQASTRPASVQNFDDTSGCRPDEELSTSVQEVQLGSCNYTSSGGGRYACGPRGYYRPGPAAPWPGDLCSGKVIAGDPVDFGNDSRQSPGGKGWSKAPVVEKIAGARCVVHWKHGYSDSAQAGWSSVYYDGPATGVPGGLFIGRKP